MDQKILVVQKTFCFIRGIARAGLVRDDCTAGKSLHHQTPHTLVDIFFLNGDPRLGNTRQSGAVRVNSSRIDEDCQDKGDDVGAGDEEDVRGSVGLPALIDGIGWGEEDEAEAYESQEEEGTGIQKSFQSGRHGCSRMVCELPETGRLFENNMSLIGICCRDQPSRMARDDSGKTYRLMSSLHVLSTEASLSELTDRSPDNWILLDACCLHPS